MAETCSPSRYIKAYEAALSFFQDGRLQEAHAAWRALAERGFAPAQSRLGRIYATGAGIGRDDVEALRWLTLAWRAGEFEAMRGVQTLRKRMTPEALAAASARLAGWKPRPDSCVGDTGGRAFTAAETGRIDNLAAARKKETWVYKGVAIAAAGKDSLEGVKKVIDVVGKYRPCHLIYLQMLEVIAVGGVESFVRAAPSQPHPGTVTPSVRLFVPALYVSGANAEAAAPTILIQAMSHLLQALDGVSATNRYSYTYRSAKLIGSTYPDADNTAFYKEVSRALDLAENLPPALADMVGRITEIRYDPPSRFSRRKIDALAYYVRSAAPERRRVVVIPRDLKYSGAAAILLTTLVHEGSHADQDLRISRKRDRRDDLKAKLMKFKNAGGGTAETEVQQIAERIRRFEEDIALWEITGKEHVAKFECEAAVNELKAKKQLGIGRSSAATYASVCMEVAALDLTREANALPPLGKSRRSFQLMLPLPSSRPAVGPGSVTGLPASRYRPRIRYPGAVIQSR